MSYVSYFATEVLERLLQSLLSRATLGIKNHNFRNGKPAQVGLNISWGRLSQGQPHGPTHAFRSSSSTTASYSSKPDR